MGKQTFDRIKKVLGVLLAIFFVVTLTVASASAGELYGHEGCRDGQCSVDRCHDGLCSWGSAVGVVATIVTAGAAATTGYN